MSDSPPIIDYETSIAPPLPPRIWGLSRSIWLLVAGFCAFLELAASFATNGRISGWGDITFTIVVIGLFLVALVNAIRLRKRTTHG